MKKVLSLFISLAILVSMISSVTVFAQSGDVTGGEVHFCEENPSHVLTLVNVVPPTSTEQGYSVYYCETCQREYKFDYTDPTGEVTPEPEHKAGDIDKSGKVDNKDATVLFRYLTGWRNITVDELILDVNGDKQVNNKDLTRLFRHLSNQDVQIFGIDEDQSGSNDKIDGSGTIYLPEVP